MDISDENKESTENPVYKSSLSTSSCVSSDHTTMIPQMIITSADDDSLEVTDDQKVPHIQVQESEFVDVSSSESTLTEETVCHEHLPQNSYTSAQETGKDVETQDEINIAESKAETRSVESISSSVISRPLMIESSSITVAAESDVSVEQLSPPQPSVPLNAVQRPLVFNGSSHATEVSTASDETTQSPLAEEPAILNVFTSEIEESNTEEAMHGKSKPKTSSFSWMPSFPKMHASDKEVKSTTSETPEIIKPVKQKISESPDSKKDGLQSVKKFFDNILHNSQSSDSKKHEDENQSVDVSTSKKANKDGAKSSIKHFFTKSGAHVQDEITSNASKSPIDIKLLDSTEKNITKSELPVRGESASIEEKKDKEKFPKSPPKTGIKKMFESFKHDLAEKIDNLSEVATTSKNVSIKGTEDIKHLPKSPPKDSSTGSKKKFVPLKHELAGKNVSSSEVATTGKITSLEEKAEINDVSKSPSKDSKTGIKKMFDSFKHDLSEKMDSSSSKKEHAFSPNETKEHSKDQKDSKSGMKKFFGSFKIEDSGLNSKESASVSISPAKSVTTETFHAEPIVDRTTTVNLTVLDKSTNDSVTKETAVGEQNMKSQKEKPSTSLDYTVKDNDKLKQKNSHYGLKKMFSSFRNDKPSTSKEEKCHVRFDIKDNSLKRSLSFRDSILLKDSDFPEEMQNTREDNFTGMRKCLSSSKQEMSESTSAKKQNTIKRSHSWRETMAEKESLHVFKNFFDSITHKNVSKSASHDSKSEEHIYDIVGKPNEPNISNDTMQIVSHQEVKMKHKDSGVKKLCESFRHKDQAPKLPESNVETTKETYIPVVASHSADPVVAEEKTVLVPSSSIEKLKQTKPKIQKEKTPPTHLNSSPIEKKPSVFNALSDNIIAFKDKLIHSKDSEKKTTQLKQNEISEEYDIQNAAKENDNNLAYLASYRPLDDIYFANQPSSSSNEIEKLSEIVVKESSVQKPPQPIVVDPPPLSTTKVEETTYENATVSTLSENKHLDVSKSMFTAPELTVVKNEKKPMQKKYPKTEAGRPETLYDTCCIRLTSLLGKKAIEIVSKQTKTPPRKPPKPSAEAIAKARATVVSQRLQDMQSKNHSIGESICVGYDGIRFADEDTESSCDYKDVDHMDYIMDYELINRYKFENKVDTNSIVSGVTSYYTADTITLREENFSDAPLETISLNSYESFQFQNLPSNSADVHTWPSSKKSKEPKIKVSENKTPSLGILKKSLICPDPKMKSSAVKYKKTPPPIPPKPVLYPKTPVTLSKESSGVSQCINGLSLSPRLQTKSLKDSAVTQKRPLLVAGLKGTEFTSFQTKSKESQNKLKERKFDTVLTNESLKNIGTIQTPATHKPFASSKSTPSTFKEHASSRAIKKTPQRPPLPSTTKREIVKVKVIAPPVPEKPKIDTRNTSSNVPELKRTVSPPRPPPPAINRVKSPPPRPPPPNPDLKSFERKHACLNPEKIAAKEDIFNVSEPAHEHGYLSQPSKTHPSSVSHRIEIFASETSDIDHEIATSDSKSPEDSLCFVSADESDDIFVDVPLCETPEIASVVNEEIFIIAPKPPPRCRRIRSRTVETVPSEREHEPLLRRSQSLSEVDIQQRTSNLKVNQTIYKSDLKHLYTSVNKNLKKNIFNSSDSDKVSRPLPAPPPPPRKFRSLDHKPKIKTKPVVPKDNENLSVIAAHNLIKAPERKKKTLDAHRFHSLSTERRKNHNEFFVDSISKLPRSNSVPLRPGRRQKHTRPEYDENANVAFPVVAEVHHSDVTLDECGNEITSASANDNIPSQDAEDSKSGHQSTGAINSHPRRKKNKNSNGKSHSSWYDEFPREESWDLVDWDSESMKEFVATGSSLDRKPVRRQSDPLAGRKIKKTSTFYVHVENTEKASPLIDKETSPVHFDCSEKSVQTSLETLSQGVTSQDEMVDLNEMAESSSDNPDSLLNIVKTLQSELRTTLNRHKDKEEECGSNNDSEKASEENNQHTSVQSSTSELWPLSSSEESDGEVSHDGSSVNLSEIAISRKKNKIFYIAQEMMTSEEVFVDVLKLLTVDFKAAVEVASKQRNMLVIPDEILSQIFNHLPQLQHLNENLWMQLKDRIENWDKNEKIADIIVKIGPFLKLYSWYIQDFESNLGLLEESKRRYPLFAQVIKEFEASPRCKRLALNHYMLKPIQRIPQYRLLLQEYLHQLSEDSLDYQDTVAALQIVSEVANHANESMKQGDNAQKLISIQHSIMGHKEIIKPGRLFIKEGELMKLSRKGMQPRWFVLFNDLLLYLTPVQQGLFRVNHELLLTGMKVAIPIQQDYQNEFSIISVTRSFTLAARSQEERQEWIVALTKAIEENASKRSTFTNIRLQQKAQEKYSEDEEGDFVLGKKAPVWIPDARVTMCQLCTSEFTVTFRRHHCRACGKVVCSICSSNRIPLHYLGGNKVNRVCDECFGKLGPGGCVESGETDSDSQQIAVKPHLRSEHRYVKKGKRNLPSVLKEVCANDQGSTISGYLQRRSGKSWKRAWFVVKDNVLYEYKASEDVAALRSTPLLGYEIESFTEAYENVDFSLLFQLTHPGQAPIVFHADSIGSTERWISALKVASVLE